MKKKKKSSERDMQIGLADWALLTKSAILCSSNVRNAFNHEMDFVYLTKNMMSYEFEIKTSVSDFKADFKKTRKHRDLIKRADSDYKSDVETKRKRSGTPNYFYYIVPDYLRDKIEKLIPDYAGFAIYITKDNYQRSRRIKIIKKASLLHNIKTTESQYKNIAKGLCFRFFSNSYPAANKYMFLYYHAIRIIKKLWSSRRLK